MLRFLECAKASIVAPTTRRKCFPNRVAVAGARIERIRTALPSGTQVVSPVKLSEKLGRTARHSRYGTTLLDRAGLHLPIVCACERQWRGQQTLVSTIREPSNN